MSDYSEYNLVKKPAIVLFANASLTLDKQINGRMYNGEINV
jgi:hypothetical protein